MLAWEGGISVSAPCFLQAAVLPTKHSTQAPFCAGLVTLMKSEQFSDLSEPAPFQLNRCTMNENAMAGAGRAEANCSRQLVSCLSELGEICLLPC